MGRWLSRQSPCCKIMRSWVQIHNTHRKAMRSSQLLWPQQWGSGTDRSQGPSRFSAKYKPQGYPGKARFIQNALCHLESSLGFDSPFMSMYYLLIYFFNFCVYGMCVYVHFCVNPCARCCYWVSLSASHHHFWRQKSLPSPGTCPFR